MVYVVPCKTQPQGGGGIFVRPAPGMNGKRKRRGRGGPVGMGGVQGVWGYMASLYFPISLLLAEHIPAQSLILEIFDQKLF